MYYDSSTFKLFSDSKERNFDVKVQYPTNQVSLNTIGSRFNNLPSIKGYVWLFKILDMQFSSNDFILESSSSNVCMIPATSCINCHVMFKDPDYGTGCLSTNINENQSSDQINCLKTGIGCAHTGYNYQCNEIGYTCFYNLKLKTCYKINMSDNSYITVDCSIDLIDCPSFAILIVDVNSVIYIDK